MATIYLRNKTYWLSYRIGGQRVSMSLKTTNRRVAEEKKKQFDAMKVAQLLPVPSNTPIGPFMQSLCEFWLKTKRGKGAKNDIGRLRRIFGPCCEALMYKAHTPYAFRTAKYEHMDAEDRSTGRYLPVKKLEEITPEAVNRFLQKRLVEDGLSPKTVNLFRITLSGMFAYARKYHGYRCPNPEYRNPIKGVDRMPEVLPPIRWMTLEEIDQQLNALTAYPVIRAMVATYIYAGLRRSEGVWLTAEDVDLTEKVIRVRAKTINDEKWVPKTNKNRVVPIGSKLLAELTAYREKQSGIWFFPSPDGTRWQADNFSTDLRAINSALNLPWSCKIYRHTFGSHLAQKGVSLFQISELMGNSPEICRKYYAALMPQKMHAEVEF